MQGVKVKSGPFESCPGKDILYILYRTGHPSATLVIPNKIHSVLSVQFHLSNLCWELKLRTLKREVRTIKVHWLPTWFQLHGLILQ